MEIPKLRIRCSRLWSLPIGALLVLAAGIAHVHDASVESQIELAAKLERVTLTEEYIRAELDRIEEQHAAEPGDPARGKALASYQRVEQLILSSSDGALAHAEAQQEAALRAKFSEIADALSRLPGEGAQGQDELDRRFDTELLPALFQSAGHESSLLAGSLRELENRSQRATRAAVLCLLGGLGLLVALVRRITQGSQRALSELLTATRALASGNLSARASTLPIASWRRAIASCKTCSTSRGSARST